MLVLLALVGVVTYFLFYAKESKPHNEEVKIDPVAVPRYSEKFTNSVNQVLDNYYALSEAFVNWDSAAIKSNSTLLKESTSAVSFNELKDDSILHNTAIIFMDSITVDLKAVEEQSDITAKRRAFNGLSKHFYNLLRTVQYDGEKVFLQECPMAFNDVETGLWLSNEAAIRNPYLGLHHPKYRSGMLECGETKDSLHAGLKSIR